MHVCHICDSSLEGDYFRNIAIGMTAKGCRTTLVELGTGEPPTWLADVPGVEFTSLGAAGRLQQLLAGRKLAKLLEERDVDILHVHLFYSGIAGILSKRSRPKTVVALMRHHTGVVRMLGSGLHVKADRWMAMKADRLMTVSEAARQYMREVDNIDRYDIKVVHIGFDFDKFAPDAAARQRVRGEFGFDADDLVIGYIANFARGKGHVELLEAFPRIHDELPNAKLLFAGRGELPEVSRAIAGLPAASVISAGWRSDIAACLNAMDIFIQPSLSEAFSQVIVEAMGTSLPVVATNVGGAAEVVENGRNGVLIEPGMPEAIAAEAIRLGHDEALRQRLGKAAREMVTAKFTVETMVDKQYELYRSWLSE